MINLKDTSDANNDNGFAFAFRAEDDNFIIWYDEIDSGCIDKIFEVLELNYKRVSCNLNNRLNEKITIEIYSDLKRLHIALGLTNAPDWIRGGLSVEKIVIASPLNPPRGSNFNNIVNTAVHEFVHILVNGLNNDIPRWLNEGIACYEAKDNDENWIKETVKSGVMNNNLPTFKDLDTGEDFETFFKYNGYQYSYTIVELIIVEFGYDKLTKLIKAPSNFIDILGFTEDQLHTKWIEFIKDNYGYCF